MTYADSPLELPADQYDLVHQLCEIAEGNNGRCALTGDAGLSPFRAAVVPYLQRGGLEPSWGMENGGEFLAAMGQLPLREIHLARNRVEMEFYLGQGNLVALFFERFSRRSTPSQSAIPA